MRRQEGLEVFSAKSNTSTIPRNDAKAMNQSVRCTSQRLMPEISRIQGMINHLITYLTPDSRIRDPGFGGFRWCESQGRETSPATRFAGIEENQAKTADASGP